MFQTRSNQSMSKGFTLIEILIVITILGILGSIVISNLWTSKEKAYMARSKTEFHSLSQALELYMIDYGQYPDDVSRGIPPGLEEYLGVGDWPGAAWPGSVYDWDNWDIEGENVVQFSIRFCNAGETHIENCKFPKEDWAKDFGINSAVYYCVTGACRSHIDKPIDYPGYCVNCND